MRRIEERFTALKKEGRKAFVAYLTAGDPSLEKTEELIPALEAASKSRRTVRQFVEEFAMGDGRRVYLLAEGRLVNLSAAEGHPASVMDMSFANQALMAEYVFTHASELEKKVYDVPEPIDNEIARLKLETMGIEIDSLTSEQEKYLRSWTLGT